MRKCFWALATASLWLSQTAVAATIDDATLARLKTLSEQTKVPLKVLSDAVAQAKQDPGVIKAINRPYEAKPWYRYQKLFVTDSRVEQGVKFWKEHAQTLARAEKTYQVPAQIIVAIIGVETRYGRFMGQYPVLDSLYTLGFHYPRRGKFFSREFASFVKLSHQQGWNLRTIDGSYAGAMGYGQFIPSSYMHYAVDFNKDGKRDIIHNPTDAIGSVANYFHQHHWQYQQPVVEPLDNASKELTNLANRKRETPYQWRELAQKGAISAQQLAPTTPVNVLALKTQADQDGYWLTFHNFYVITRYNTSPLYAMAVYQLSQKLKHAYKP
ncbi:lytic murein transglycosylase B [Celerinatantimonas diazotrophica]|uniref:Membrane-bound lytic murein transglycosylase B n=1 Tax=Celerinatantimonas diazotrophica TaxID=412034 RepID=A0A4R1K410_9GAMM|nr:lytic murein transglycosylase B [Celerinatantimonas diazotrophica]TCK58647.1 membrane-bound lytic murein transglycosylase B [Celerinatantimonas diazotrophica]CAG9297276.1 Membrane-bound lytic murein transglycosylase B [Celerinatantimonas diazotrophica]